MKINLGDGVTCHIDLEPGPHGEHRKVRMYQDARKVCEFRLSGLLRIMREARKEGIK